MPQVEQRVCLSELFFKQRVGANNLKTVTGVIETLATASYNEMIGNLRTVYADMWSTYLTT